MKRILWAAVAIAGAAGCRQIANIGPLVYADAGGPGATCTNATLVMTSQSSLEQLTATNGFVAASIESGSGLSTTGIVDCAAGTTCTQPKNLLTLAFSDEFGAYAASSSLIYTLNQASGGSLHSVGFDGTGDTVLLSGLKRPLWTAVSGARTFWVDDDQTTLPASVHCLGCSGGDAVWMPTPATTYGVFADANDVYVIGDVDANGTVAAVYGCPVTGPCTATTRRTVISGLNPSVFAFGSTLPDAMALFASDGANVYVSDNANQVVRVDASGAQTTLVAGVAAGAIAVDPQTKEIFLGDDGGRIARAPSDGSSPPVTISACAGNDLVFWLAFDAQNVYALVYEPDGSSAVYAIKR